MLLNSRALSTAAPQIYSGTVSGESADSVDRYSGKAMQGFSTTKQLRSYLHNEVQECESLVASKARQSDESCR